MQDFLKSWGLLLGALVIGVVAFFVATNYLDNAERAMRENLEGMQGSTTEVVVASSDLAAGTVLSSDNLAVAELPSNHISKSVVTPEMFSEIDGSLLNVDMNSGEPLLGHFLEGVLVERFSELIKEGERAVTIEVDTYSSNAGLLSVGDYVDIFLSGSFAQAPKRKSKNKKKVMVPLFQRIKVLAVDRNPLLTKEQEFRAQDFIGDEDVFEYSSVTLALLADDADNLAFASSLGDIVFLLRSAGDDSLQEWSPVDQLTVLGNGSNNGSYMFFGKSSQSAGEIQPEARQIVVSALSNLQSLAHVPASSTRIGEAKLTERTGAGFNELIEAPVEPEEKETSTEVEIENE